jgi:arylsulfatase A-like enzyme
MAGNVLLVTVDSLRWDVLAKTRNKTASNIHSLAQAGTEFTRAIANGPNTPSSFPSILTGTHPMMHGGYRYLDEARSFISRSLNRAGFTTVGYHSNPHLGPEMNYDYGFDIFNDGRRGKDGFDTLIEFADENISSDSRLYSLLRRFWHVFSSATGTSAYKRAEPITNDALDWLIDRDDDQFFMWIHYMDVHYPFQPPDKHLQAIGQDSMSARRVAKLNDAMQENPELLSESDIADLRTLYRGELHYVDHHVGRLLDELADQGIRDETMVIFTADHGEAFGEHGRWGHHPYMYDELLRVPLIVDESGRNATTIGTQVSLIDIFPTVCDACGIKRPPKLQGENLFTKDGKVELATSRGGECFAARTPQWKCLWYITDNEVELYDLSADPKETEDVSDHNPDVVEWLKGEIEEYRDVARATDTELPDVEESEEVKQRLRDLGYTE